MIGRNHVANVPNIDGRLAHVDHMVNAMNAFLDSIASVAFRFGVRGKHTAFEAKVANVGRGEEHYFWKRLSISALVVFLRGTYLGKDFMYNFAVSDISGDGTKSHIKILKSKGRSRTA